MKVGLVELNPEGLLPFTRSRAVQELRLPVLSPMELWNPYVEELLFYIRDDFRFRFNKTNSETTPDVWVNSSVVLEVEKVIELLRLGKKNLSSDGVLVVSENREMLGRNGKGDAEIEGFRVEKIQDIISALESNFVWKVTFNSLMKTGRFKKLRSKNGIWISGEGRVFVAEGVKIYPPVSFITDEGDIFVDSGSIIKPFTVIEGPSYIGRDSVVDRAIIRERTVVGNVCKIGGEVECSVVNNYSNKHHDGFLGHSVVGFWVNIGAIATTSDLKNTYGEVKLKKSTGIEPSGRIKLGSFIGDHSKIGIGVMLNTGTIVDFGVNLFYGEGLPPKYIPPFYWGNSGKMQIYDIGKFLEVAEKVMKRRGVELCDDEKKLYRKLYHLSVLA